MNQEQQDRRGATRLRSVLPVRFITRIEDRKLQFKFADLGYSSDASKVGILLVTNKWFKIGDVTKFWITLPFQKENRKPLLKGEVKWLRTKKNLTFEEDRFNELKYCCGLKLMESEERWEMDDFIDFWQTLAG